MSKVENFGGLASFALLCYCFFQSTGEVRRFALWFSLGGGGGMGGLTDFDQKVLSSLRDFRVLDDVHPRDMNQDKGVIVVACGDCDQWWDLMRRMVFFFRAYHFWRRLWWWVWPRLHLIMLNGGPLNIPPDSPLCEGLPIGQIIFRDIRNASRLKGITSVALKGHVPCGAAGLASVDLLQAYGLMFEAKHTARKAIAGFDVVAFCHVDYGRRWRWLPLHRKRTYILNRERWAVWNAAEETAGLREEIERRRAAAA